MSIRTLVSIDRVLLAVALTVLVGGQQAAAARCAGGARDSYSARLEAVVGQLCRVRTKQHRLPSAVATPSSMRASGVLIAWEQAP